MVCARVSNSKTNWVSGWRPNESAKQSISEGPSSHCRRRVGCALGVCWAPSGVCRMPGGGRFGPHRQGGDEDGMAQQHTSGSRRMQVFNSCVLYIKLLINCGCSDSFNDSWQSASPLARFASLARGPRHRLCTNATSGGLQGEYNNPRFEAKLLL